MRLCGDARCDSPGYSATYGTYTLMDMLDGLICGFSLVQVTETDHNSGAMEKEGLRRLLLRLRRDGLNVSLLATDRSPQIRAMMRREFPTIKHQFDIWHFAKSVTKKLHKSSKKKDYATLRQWIPAIETHLWWSASNCNRDPKVLRKKWTSVVHHITDKHTWTGNEVFHQCEHGVLPDADQIAWLDSAGAEAEAL